MTTKTLSDQTTTETGGLPVELKRIVMRDEPVIEGMYIVVHEKTGEVALAEITEYDRGGYYAMPYVGNPILASRRNTGYRFIGPLPVLS